MARRRTKGDYAVGYGRPPKHSQFRKGQSGNPKGRPKGARNFSTLVREELSRNIWVTDNGEKRQITVLEAILKRLIRMALEGDLRAGDRILKFLELLEAEEARAAATGTEADGAGASAGDLEMLRHFADIARSGGFGPEDEEPDT